MAYQKILTLLPLFLFSMSVFSSDNELFTNACAPNDEECIAKNYIEQNRSPVQSRDGDYSQTSPGTLPDRIILKKDAQTPPEAFINLYECGDGVCKLKK